MGIATENMAPFYLTLQLCKEPKLYKDHWKTVLIACLLMTAEYFSYFGFLFRATTYIYVYTYIRETRNSSCYETPPHPSLKIILLDKIFIGWLSSFSSVIFSKYDSLIRMFYSQSHPSHEAQMLLAFSNPTRQNWPVFLRAPKGLLIIALLL